MTTTTEKLHQRIRDLQLLQKMTVSAIEAGLFNHDDREEYALSLERISEKI